MATEFDPRQFLRVLDQDEAAAEEKYRELFEKLVKFFEWRRCHPADEKAQETLFRGLKRIADGADVFAQDPGGYFYGIAKFIQLETWSKAEPANELDPDAVASPLPHPARQAEARILLQQGLSALSPAKQKLLLQYLNGDQRDREAMARQLGMTANNLRVTTHRLIKLVRKRLGARSEEDE